MMIVTNSKLTLRGISKVALPILISMLLSSCGGGGGGGPVEDPSITPPQSSVTLPTLMSTITASRVDARDALASVPVGYTANDLVLSLIPINGSNVSIKEIEKGLWEITPVVTGVEKVSLKLESQLAGNTQSKTLEGMAYADIDETRQVFSFGQANWSSVAAGGELNLPLKIRQVKTTASPGASVRIHFSGDAWDWGGETLIQTEGRLAAGVLYKDTKNHDDDDATNYFVLLSWFDSSLEGWSVPHDGIWHDLAMLKFVRKPEGTGGSRFKISTIDAPVGMKTVSIASTIGTDTQ